MSPSRPIFGDEYAWPEPGTELPFPTSGEGWLSPTVEQLLGLSLSPQARLVVELGSWAGFSTRRIAERAPNATVIVVDPWRPRDRSRCRLEPVNVDPFSSLCRPYRDRIVRLFKQTTEGLQAIAARGLRPDVIFVVAEGRRREFYEDLECSLDLFSRVTVIGESSGGHEMRQKLVDLARARSLGVEFIGKHSPAWRIGSSLSRWDERSLADREPSDDERSSAALHRWVSPSTDNRSPDPGRFAACPDRSRHVVLVPHLHGIEPECEQALFRLQQDGVRIVRASGCSQIDVARNQLASDALHDGFEAILFIDADIGFAPRDALSLLDRPEPVLAGVYAKKGCRGLASVFADGLKEVVFGKAAPQLYPLKYAATGFLRIRSDVLRRMISELGLPLCNKKWGRGIWPFFQPAVVPEEESAHYLGEDWAFSHRLAQIGITPLADTSIRLWHWGRYSYSWEDAGADHARYERYTMQL